MKYTKLITTLLTLCLSVNVYSQTYYKTLGATSNPKVPAKFNRYHSHAQATKLLKDLAKAHPEICKLQSLGKSYGKRDMWQISITNFKTPNPNQKTAFWIDGGIHANELQGVEVSLYTAWYLCEMYGKNKFVTDLLDQRIFYIVPMLSPDSRDAHMTEPNTTHSPRTGLRPIDDDMDGEVDEDGADDLDGDGSITSMRIVDPHGMYKADPDYPNLMVRIKDGEKRPTITYTHLGREGIDNDGDGRVNEDGDGSYDPNRDWAWNWQPKHIQRGAHYYPFSIKENRMIADFILKHANIAGAQSYHNTGGMILRGPGALNDRYSPADLRVYDKIGNHGQDLLPGYRYINIAKDLYEVYGGSVDWYYQMRGIYSFTNELHTPFNHFRRNDNQREDAKKFNKYLLFDGATTPWTEVEHPKYGKVEVGGSNKHGSRQPPSFLIEEECHRNMAFTLYHADQMPKVSIKTVETKDFGNGLTQVVAYVYNDRVTPTHASVDVTNKITVPDILSITGQDLKVMTGQISRERFFENAREQRLNPKAMRISNIPGNGGLYVRWIVKGSGKVELKLRSMKGGSDKKSVELKG